MLRYFFLFDYPPALGEGLHLYIVKKVSSHLQVLFFFPFPPFQNWFGYFSVFPARFRSFPQSRDVEGCGRGASWRTSDPPALSHLLPNFQSRVAGKAQKHLSGGGHEEAQSFRFVQAAGAGPAGHTRSRGGHQEERRLPQDPVVEGQTQAVDQNGQSGSSGRSHQVSLLRKELRQQSVRPPHRMVSRTAVAHSQISDQSRSQRTLGSPNQSTYAFFYSIQSHFFNRKILLESLKNPLG